MLLQSFDNSQINNLKITERIKKLNTKINNKIKNNCNDKCKKENGRVV